MSKTILINAREADSSFGDTRVAIVDNGTLTDFDVDSQWKEKNRGNIYSGVVTNVEPSLQAAFVDFGAKKQGFLPLSDVAPHAYKPDHPSKVNTITDALKRKQRIMVQVLKEEMGNKGAALTTFISLPGRYLVFMPNGDGAHISRKIEDEDERKRIKALAKSLDAPDDVGLIVRTAGMEQPKEVLQRDLRYLSKMWDNIDARVKNSHGPRLVHRDSDTIIRTLRDYVTPDVTRIVVDTEQAYETAREFLELSMPDHVGMLSLHQGGRPLFSEFQVDSQVEGLFDRRAPLPSGGYLIIDQTEALVAIDVNSGRATKEGSQEETAYRTNMEAAVEVARQLKLRDLGGIVVVDFIDMMKESHNAEVEKRFREAIKSDKARFRVSPISQHGLLEMTRQRIRPALMDGMMTTCAHCDGRGKVRAVGSEGSHMLRAMADRLSVDMKPGFTGTLTVQAHTRIAFHLLNERRDAVLALEQAHHVRIRFEAQDALPSPHYALLLDREQSSGTAANDDKPRATAQPANAKPHTKATPQAGGPPEQVKPHAPKEVGKPGHAKNVTGAIGEGDAAPAQTETDPAAKKRRRRGGKGRAADGASSASEPTPTVANATTAVTAAPEDLWAVALSATGEVQARPDGSTQATTGPRLASSLPRLASQLPAPHKAKPAPRVAQDKKHARDDEDAFEIAMVPMPSATAVAAADDDTAGDDVDGQEEEASEETTTSGGAPKKRRRRRGGRGRKRSGRALPAATT